MAHIMNAQLELARRYVEQTGVSLFLTGKAGTGKTTFLHDIDRHCPKQHVVVAPTGVAAVNAGGVTIHSFFQLPFDPYLPDVKELVTEYQMPDAFRGLSKNKLNIIRSLELLIIDEISMVRADLLDAVDMTLRRVRRSARPFGGVQLLMIGDVHQLPPVVKEQERSYMERVYPSPFFFHSKALQQLQYVTVELTTVYRQQDATFVDLLNKVRNNQMDAATLAALNARVGTPQHDAITLTTHNHQADAINRAHMLALQGDSRTFQAVIRGNFPDTMYPVECNMEVKVGERVMFTKNDSSGVRRYYNGKLATVTAFLEPKEKGKNIAIEVTCDDGETINVGHEQWENIKYTVSAKTGEIEQLTDGTFSQYPLRAAWAVTIHKAQGLTFDRVSVNAADAFAFGQVYVALSRCRSLEGLTLSTPLSPTVTFSDTDVQRFCNAQPTFEQAQASVEQAEEQYYYEQLADLFDMNALVADMERTVALYDKLRGTYPKQADAFNALLANTASLASVSERFNTQLIHLPREQHAERVSKATAYYLQQLTAVQVAITTLLDIEVDNKETARQLHEASETLTDRLATKVTAMRTVANQGFSINFVQKVKASTAKTKKKEPRNRTATKQQPASSDTTPSSNNQPNTKHLPLTPAPAEDPQERLVRVLRRWRSRKAADEGAAPYFILQQKALLAIAANRPDTIDELRKLVGIGAKTIDKYGQELLEIVSSETLKNR